MPRSTAPAPLVKVWDPLVRLCHWVIVAGVAANFFITEEGKLVHRWIGYTVLGAVALRFVWGLIGTRHARFSDFIPSPFRLWSYGKALLQRREPRYVGHNPAGAAMMMGLLILLLIIGVTGWMQTLDAYWGVQWVQNAHALSADTIMALAGLHALAAIRESVRHHENLIWSMITGRKRAASGSDVDHALASDRGQ